jgi:hypothetical protein
LLCRGIKIEIEIRINANGMIELIDQLLQLKENVGTKLLREWSASKA